MPVVVRKYGGSSVATIDRIRRVAEGVVETRRSGADVAVVVSAMGDTTDDFLEMARQVDPTPDCRERDMLLTAGERISISLLAMAIQSLGVEAISLTGPQAGFLTTPEHTHARILQVRPGRVREELSRGRVVVVAGFQGASETGETTTLGRGGSDTSAVALAAALQADTCEICSDVDGVYSADPRKVAGARKLEEIGYGEMLELARHGARVLKSCAVDFARRQGVVLRARSSFSAGRGTLVKGIDRRGTRVVGVAGRGDVLSVRLGRATEGGLREALAGCELLHRSPGHLVVTTENVADADAFAAGLPEALPGSTVETGLGSATVVGGGVGRDAETLLRTHRALRRGGVACAGSYAGRDAVTCLVARGEVDRAVRALHRALVEEEVAACL